MTDPTTAASATFGLTALAITLLGPIAGPYALIAFAALSGAMWPLSAAGTANKLAGAWLLIRCTLTAVVLTAFLAGLVESMTDLPDVEVLAPVAFAVGALGNGWHPVLDALRAALTAIVSRLGGKT